ncbi:DoxX family protein [Elioraea rosea]|uniref:DoxX family protein n=1 Tax=Elioraea rosea TaxID=2492390 RepID=UPI001315127B|nr:DoxX family protein [Elioraea rosea]
MNRRDTCTILSWMTWPAAIWIAYEFLWYEQYKLTGNEGSVHLFTILTDWLGFPGHEKVMRIGVGIIEIVASVLVVIPATRMAGAALAFCIMAGAIFFHVVSPLGIDPYGDGGVLFKEAVFTLLMAAVILWVKRDEGVAALGRLRSWLQRAEA